MGMKVLAPEPVVAPNQRKTNREQKNYTRVTRRDMGVPMVQTHWMAIRSKNTKVYTSHDKEGDGYVSFSLMKR